jgi:hypothetical protein
VLRSGRRPSAQMADWIRREIAKYGPVVKAANIKAE